MTVLLWLRDSLYLLWTGWFGTALRAALVAALAFLAYESQVFAGLTPPWDAVCSLALAAFAKVAIAYFDPTDTRYGIGS